VGLPKKIIYHWFTLIHRSISTLVFDQHLKGRPFTTAMTVSGKTEAIEMHLPLPASSLSHSGNRNDENSSQSIEAENNSF
jgi:hypothetical protein